MIEIRHIEKQDYKKAQNFATRGMHFNWYSDNPFILALYSKYFWHMELNRATHAYGAYVNGHFVGVLLAEIKGERKPYRRLYRTLFVQLIERLQTCFIGKGVDDYTAVNRAVLNALKKQQIPDGEIVFLAADPNCEGQGIGTALIAALEADIPGKTIYLYTDSGCNYQFYDHRGFERAGTCHVIIDIKGKKVPLQCYLYSKRIPGKSVSTDHGQ